MANLGNKSRNSEWCSAKKVHEEEERKREYEW
jgi:hypothetical protein